MNDLIINGNSLEVLQKMPSKSINCCITSPPYYGLRDYGVEEQIGQEANVDEYIQALIDIFKEVMRVLTDDGTLWLNISDSYSGSGKGRLKDGKSYLKTGMQTTNKGSIAGVIRKTSATSCKPKDLIGVPWLLAFALREQGWYLRQDIIWNKPNCMPESVKDRCTRSHEYIFLLTKSRKYFYDAEAIKEKSVRYDKNIRDRSKGKLNKVPGRTKMNGLTRNDYETRNKRSVWTIATVPYKDAHFATFPPDLVKPCILAGCPINGTVLDPFCGSGTVGMVAKKLNREFIGIELNPDYCILAEERITKGI